MEERAIQGYIGMSRDFILSGYPARMYYQKLAHWIDRRNGVSDEFFFWLDTTYELTLKERQKIMDAYSRDLWGEEGRNE